MKIRWSEKQFSEENSLKCSKYDFEPNPTIFKLKCSSTFLSQIGLYLEESEFPSVENKIILVEKLLLSYIYFSSSWKAFKKSVPPPTYDSDISFSVKSL